MPAAPFGTPSNFYPRSPCGERPYASPAGFRLLPYFYPRSPCGERLAPEENPTQKRDFYPRSPCGERQSSSYSAYLEEGISIHALLAESDHHQSDYLYLGRQFLSTLSLRRATESRSNILKTSQYFYPRSPCGERRSPPYNLMIQHKISIHALLAESDQSRHCAR